MIFSRSDPFYAPQPLVIALQMFLMFPNAFYARKSFYRPTRHIRKTKGFQSGFNLCDRNISYFKWILPQMGVVRGSLDVQRKFAFVLRNSF